MISAFGISFLVYASLEGCSVKNMARPLAGMDTDSHINADSYGKALNTSSLFLPRRLALFVTCLGPHSGLIQRRYWNWWEYCWLTTRPVLINNSIIVITNRMAIRIDNKIARGGAKTISKRSSNEIKSRIAKWKANFLYKFKYKICRNMSVTA